MSSDSAQPPVPQSQPGGHTPQPFAPQQPPAPRRKTNVVGLIALIASVLGFIFAVIPGAFGLGWLLLGCAFVLSLVSFFLAGRKVFGIIALVLSIVGTIAGVIAFIATLSGIVDDAVDGADTAISQGPSADTAGETDDEPAASVQELTVVESAFGRSSYDASTWWYVVVLENPNPDHIFNLAEVTVEAMDPSGTILDSASSYSTILSGRTVVAGSFIDVGQGEIAQLDVRGPDAGAAQASRADETGAFSVADVAATSDGYSTSVTGLLTGTFSEEQQNLRVDVVARGADGAILGAESAWVDRLPVGGQVQFAATFLETLPDGTTYEAYPSL